MKRLLFLIICLSFITVPLLGNEEIHIDRGHNQIEIQSLQFIDISPVLEMPSVSSIDMISQDGEIFHVSKKPLLTLKDFTHADVSIKEKIVSLNLSLTKAAGKSIHEFTSKNLGRKLAFIVNGNLIKAPRVRTPIDGKGISIDPLEKSSADRLATLINDRVK